ncbi:MAG TPA: hypothetical protein VE225_04035, partial [Rubrobacteraceae bacterium]|nr:hypothetical protein [Rubrobacteraceae bacterium]
RTPDGDALGLWYELGTLYARAGEDGRRAFMWGFTLVCVTGALVLLSAPLFGTSWAGPFAPAIPVSAGLLVGGGSFGWRRLTFLKKRNALRRALAEKGTDADRPTAGGLNAYYDAQLILLRSEYEFLRSRGTKRALSSARLFEGSFGFTPEDPFECGPLNVQPDTEAMRLLRERWDARLAARRALGKKMPALGLREDLAYHVFPREMIVPLELATRSAYLAISCDLFRERYGPKAQRAPENVRRRAEKDLREYRALARR